LKSEIFLSGDFMNQSTLSNRNNEEFHVAIIMDGSGRWARMRGLARPQGHRAGVEAVRRVVRAAPELGISTLTLHAFSSDNWQRPVAEVKSLHRIFEEYLRGEIGEWRARGVRVSVFGRRDRLGRGLLDAIRRAEMETHDGQALHLRLAIDYSSSDAIVAAAGRFSNGPADRESFARRLAEEMHGDLEVSAVDLLIRTGGEQRLSDFMLWECAYAELYFTPWLWPDFAEEHLRVAVKEFNLRDRRFGHIPESIAV
jgi:undecaprenyl diphosphate synthase